ncbi:hypothetical protein [Chryseobacterium camelliae]|uniref:hypothetical protein n=1 Tax=Chryseobacterium camelliae TaxID=1265445 RepID=UPI0028639B66|nr:hypothetical protein [Chryseobacterium camelliae]MDR6515202.1 hypothetical protein [Chryseobacterium camelliae]
MLTDNKMLEIAKKCIKLNEEEINIELIIVEQLTIIKPYGNIYSYGPKDPKYRLAGNGPFLVKNDTGLVIQFGTSNDVGYDITGYEDGTWKPASYGVWYPNHN